MSKTVKKKYASYEELKENLRVRLVDIRPNRENVENSIHRNVGCGYALVAYLRIPGEDGSGIGNLPESLAKKAGREEGEILRDALFRMEAEEEAHLTPIREMVLGPGRDGEVRDVLRTGENPRDEVLVLTAGDGRFGAAALFYPGMQEKIGEIVRDDYYILPSSVHEVLIVSAGVAQSPREMAEIVKSINESQVAPRDRLGNRVLRYRRGEGTLEVAWDTDRARIWRGR